MARDVLYMRQAPAYLPGLGGQWIPGMIAVGSILYGFCGGLFGRDSYANKRVEAFGIDWIVAREMDSGAAPVFASGDGILQKLEDDTHPEKQW